MTEIPFTESNFTFYVCKLFIFAGSKIGVVILTLAQTRRLSLTPRLSLVPGEHIEVLNFLRKVCYITFFGD